MRRSLLILPLFLIALTAACDDAPKPTTEAPTTEKAAEAVAPVDWGKVETLAGEGAIQVCAPDCAAVTRGAEIAVGATVNTDAVVRAAVHLSDDSTLQIDAGSQLVVQGKGELQLERGRVLLETPGTARIDTPAGKVELQRGSVAVRAETAPDGSARTRISLLSGSATLQSGADVKPLAAGESAMAEGGAVTIRPSASLAYQTAWAQELRVEAEAEDSGEAPRGVGNIYGKNPATRQELPESISIQSLTVNTTVRGRVARTEVEQVFKNNTHQTLEGYYTFPLPPDASIVRFAMEVNGKLMEGEIVEKQRAVKIFDQIVADWIRPRDPALLEWKGGNTFQMRIFPIFGGGEPKIILWYTQVLSADGTETRYTYPLPRTGKVAIDRFTYTAEVEAAQPMQSVRTPMYAASIDQGAGAAANTAKVRFDKEGFSPRHDVVLEWELPQYAPAAVYTGKGPEGEAGAYFMMVLRPDLLGVGAPEPNAAPERRRDHVFIVDTSYGTAEGDLKAQTAAVASWLTHLGPDDRFNIIAGNQTMTSFGQGLQGASTEHVQEALAFLEGQKPAGASHVEGMFTAAARQLGDAVDPVVVYLGDGHATLGETRYDALLDAIEGAFGNRRPTVHAIGIGSDVDTAFLQRLTRRFGGVAEVLNRGEDVPQRAEAMAVSTGRRTLRQAALTFSSDQVEAVYPRFVPTLRQGEELMVVGRFKGEVDGQVTLTGMVGEQPFAQPFAVRLSERESQTGSFVPRTWAQRHVEHLTQYEGDAARDAIVATSTRHTVMSRYTAFLVLESERMYREFRVDRNKNRDYWDGKGDAKADDKAAKDDSKSLEDAEDADATPTAEAPSTDEPAPPSPPLDDAFGPSDAPASGASVDGADPELARAEQGDSGISAGGESAGSGFGKAAGGAAKASRAPAKKVSAARPSSPRRSKGGLDDLADFGGGGGGGGGRGRHYTTTIAQPYVTISSVSAEPAGAMSDAVRALQTRIDAEPLRRDYRRRMVKHFIQRGDAASALDATRAWLDKDPNSAEAQWKVADLLARTGEPELAEVHFGNAIELAPADANGLRRWAEHLTLRGQHNLAVAARKALLGSGGDVNDELELVMAQSFVEPAAARARLQQLRSRARLDRAQQSRADAIDARIQGARGDDKVDLRGAGTITLSWEGPADLDLSLVLPYGERISPDVPSSSVARGKRGRMVLTGEQGHAVGSGKKDAIEAIAMAFAPVGHYQIEVVRRGDTSAPVEATVAISINGSKRTFKVTVPGGDRDARVADVEVGVRYKRVQRYDRYDNPF